MTQTIILAIGFMLIFEGIGPFLFPNRWSAYMRALVNEKLTTLRQIGAILCVFGAILVIGFW